MKLIHGWQLGWKFGTRVDCTRRLTMTKNIWFDKNLLRSPAFRSLKKWSLLVYLDFLRKRQMEQVKRVKRSDEWTIKNNGEIVYPYSEAEHKGIGRREFRNALDELVEKGFLDIAHQGFGGYAGDMTKYFIDDRWNDYGTSSFRPAKKPRKKDIRKGRGWSVFHANKNKSPVTKLIPSKAASISNSATPDKKSRILPNDKNDIRREEDNKINVRNRIENYTARQLTFWSNNNDTIL